jgi:hypothetical protein
MPTTTFHVTSSLNRESIRSHGLDWTRMRDVPGVAGATWPEAPVVFLARDVDETEWFVAMSRRNHRSVDVWEVTLPETFDVHDDPPAGTAYRELDGFLCLTEPVPPERLRLVRADA